MTTLTVGTIPIEPTATPSSRPPSPADPDAFAAELASAASVPSASSPSSASSAERSPESATAGTPGGPTASPSDARTDAADAAPSGERRDRRHAIAGAASDGTPDVALGAGPGAGAVTAAVTPALTAALPSALPVSGDPASAGTADLAVTATPSTTLSAAAAAPETLASAASPSPSSAALAAASLEGDSVQPSRPASRAPSARAADPADPATMPGAISLSPTSTPTATTATTAVAPPTPPTPPLNAQLAPTLFHLRSAEAGTHVLTLTVAPESVGPVTVRAHVGADGIRIELSAPTAQGRSALDAILPELRRDLSQGGMNSALSLAAPSSDGSASGRSPFDGAGASFTGDRGPDRSPTVPGAPTARDSSSSLSVSVPTQLRSGATALDVFA